MKNVVCLAFVLFLWTLQNASAAPATSLPVNYQLPDGSEITIYLRGDEWLNWAVTPDGYTLLRNSDGFFEYAIHDQSGDLTLSGVRARNETERTTEEKNFLSGHPKELRHSDSQTNARRQIYDPTEDPASKHTGEAPARKALQGTVRIPVILVGFQDKPFTRSKVEYEMLLDSLNYKATADGAIPGSLRDYYLANSYGQMDLRVDVFGPYTLSNNLIYYDQYCSSQKGEPRHMAREAIEMAAQDGANFADYDHENSGTVKAVHIIFAGNGQESGASSCGALWAHAWNLLQTVTYNGKNISRYSCSPEFRGDISREIAYIGTVAHELGHSLCGLPDFYDTDDAGSGGYSVTVGTWDIMSNGSKNDGGRTPSFFSAYGRDYCGWVPAVELSEAAEITISNPTTESAVYRISTDNPNEYFLLENRQRTGWDAYIPGSGLLIYHVDRNNGGWTSCVNCNPNRRGYYVKQAGCDEPTGCFPSRETDPFPQGNRTSFTDETVPDAKSYAGVNTNKPVTNIKHNTSTRTVSFRFMGGHPTTVDVGMAEILLPSSLPGAGLWDVEVRLENFELPITSATIEWMINGVAQTPYYWSGNLPSGYQTTVKIGSANLTVGTHTIRATVSTPNDVNASNNTLSKSVRVVNAFFYEDWEDDVSDWRLVNGSIQVNRWLVGTSTAADGNRSIYISDDSSANQYTFTSASTVHFYRDVTFPSSRDSFDFFFDFKGVGNWSLTYGPYDYLDVRLAETSVTPAAGSSSYAGTSIGTYYNTSEWQTMHAALPSTYSGTTKRLVFSWINGHSGGADPPAAVDNIVLASRSIIPNAIEIPIETLQAAALRAWIRDGFLHISGLTVGQPWRLYNVSGTLVYQGVTTSDVETLHATSLPHGTYIIHSENKSLKITH